MAVTYNGTIFTIINTAPSTTTATGKVSTAQAVGRFMVIVVKCGAGFSVSSVTDARGNTYSSAAYNQTAGPDIDIWYAPITTALQVNDLVTITASGSTNNITGLMGLSFSGVGAFLGNYVDQMVSPGTTSSPANATTKTQVLPAATGSFDLLISAVGTGGTGTQTFTYATGSGWTGVAETATTKQIGLQYKIQTAKSTDSNAISWSASVTYAYSMASFFPLGTNNTATTTSTSRIVKNFTNTTTTVSEIQKSFNTTTATQSRIAKNFSATQPTISKIASNVISATTTSISRISKGFTQTTSTVSRVKQIGVNRKNWTTNPNLETSIAGWGVSGAATSKTIAQSSTDKYSGTYSAYATGLLSSTATYGGIDIPISTVPLVIGQKYTISVWVNVTSYGGPNSISIKFYWGAASSSSVLYSASGWQRISVTGTAPVGATTITSQIFVIGGSGTQSTYSFYADNALLEINDGVGTYFDGSTTGGAWDGTANLSTSTISGAVTLSKSKIQKSLTNTTSTISRISKGFTGTTTTVSRINKNFSSTSTTVSRIIKNLTSTTSAISRIAKSFTATQTSVSRIVKNFTNTTTTLSRIKNTSLIATQTSISNVRGIVPYVIATQQTTKSTSSSTTVVTLPTYSAGQTVLIILSYSNSIAFPGAFGWTKVVSGPSTGVDYVAAIYRVMDGTEGSTVTIIEPISKTAAVNAYTLATPPTNYIAISSSIVAKGTTTSTTITPGALSTLPSANYLTFTTISNPGGTVSSVSSYPSNMTTDQLAITNTSTVSGIATASNTSYGITSFTPSSYTVSASQAFTWVTFAFYYQANFPVQTLYDQFHATSLDTTKWNAVSGGTGTYTTSNATISSASGIHQAYITSATNYNFYGSSMSIRWISQTAVSSTSVFGFYFRDLLTASSTGIYSNGVDLLIQNSGGTVSTIVNGATVLPLYLKMYESGGTTYYQTSTNGVTYTTVYSQTNPFSYGYGRPWIAVSYTHLTLPTKRIV